jgi:putative addiction module killer protein
MFEVYRTDVFVKWVTSLRDRKAAAILSRRLRMLERDGHFGDCKQVAAGILEMRIHAGPGYRVYLTRRGQRIVVLLCAGDKTSQERDIARAAALAEKVEI